MTKLHVVIFILLAAPLASAAENAFEVFRDDETSFSAEISAITPAQVVLTAKEGTKTLPLASIVKLRNLARNPYDKEAPTLVMSPQQTRSGRVSRPGVPVPVITPEQEQIRKKLLEAGKQLAPVEKPKSKAGSFPESFIVAELRDGSQLALSSFSIEKEAAVCQLIGQTNNTTMPIDKITSIRLAVRNLSEMHTPAEDWQRHVKGGGKGDRIVTGSPGKFDVYDGVLESTDDKTIAFSVDGETLKVPRQKVYGIILHNSNAAAPPALPRPSAILTLWAGTKVLAADMHMEEDALTCKTLNDVSVAVPMDAVLEINFGEKGAVPLAELVFACKERSVPLMRQESMPKVLEKFYANRDKNMPRGFLIDGVHYERGITLTGKTTFEFQIPRSFASLKGVIGVEDQFRPYTMASVQILADGQVLGTWQVRGDKPAERIQLKMPPNCRVLTITTEPPADSELPAVVTFGNMKLYEQ